MEMEESGSRVRERSAERAEAIVRFRSSAGGAAHMCEEESSNVKESPFIKPAVSVYLYGI